MAKSQCRILLKIFKILSINKQVKLQALEQAKKSKFGNLEEICYL